MSSDSAVQRACWRVVWSEGDRLPQGYTNRTRRVPGTGIVEKVYEGRDARTRLHREAECLRLVASVLPVPAVVEQDEHRGVLRMEWIAGTPGQQLLRSGSPRAVLAATGSLLRQLQTEATSVLAAVLEGAGPVAVHGDFGPHNLLFGADDEVVALLDWEFAYTGSALDDLAWAEWIVRMHHAEAIDALDELFDAYGTRPRWEARRKAMLVHCERVRWRCESEGRVEPAATWRGRLETTEQWRE
jgi:Ser/Thr protein kinase RdoA (MazF antagonist)